MKPRIIRHKRIRAKIKGTAERPRFSVFKSNRHFFIQLIDDEAQKTLISVSDKEIKSKSKSRKIIAREIGKILAKKALIRGVKNVVFDRGGYKFHGIISELAEGAREGGLKF
ncbi:50S ribosomal protein L18 [Candidatus Azambacteria bacterium RIFOXYD1_FULL_42_11]|uniref:Large ribosomal subunit protein uL18 n=4 Tax=Candidatus Azamiibacteriota TaxID=1752741 RepID=A0A0G0ZB33_9BACT|nr:MAG: 50S ribosomal protein L18 [Candidatus Azambacteria bacterium GW2011_GWB1_42_17]KKS45869.1 MAG: 50S ribosomal protein L18 [Candidatus Azambacteria bacterium GW2011_GWA1_42_19]KKS75254.1 MAG: 50S ribosomal protein L18 [Candidatus Azambacteria bacterium GW2011_GWA2_42_9]KKS88337.1 MAG: 50S ribosomal protein L18 [Parcubacteria group bacterium GW2011_GWC1_43_11]OGD41968.1 MAG: 50S ribosomal protein L18 [Candidatus Azambacteria bacterium RIFOXYD1_FULL_42_11]